MILVILCSLISPRAAFFFTPAGARTDYVPTVAPPTLFLLSSSLLQTGQCADLCPIVLWFRTRPHLPPSSCFHLLLLASQSLAFTRGQHESQGISATGTALHLSRGLGISHICHKRKVYASVSIQNYMQAAHLRLG